MVQPAKPPIPPKRRDLKNPYGSHVDTSEPIPASKPDMRRYPKRHTYPVCPPEVTPAERLAWRLDRKRDRPEVTRWRLDTGGVVDQVGNLRTATRECRHCGAWFAVSRIAVDGRVPTAPWPAFCSETCREVVDGVNKRKAQKRQKDGTAKPRHRAEVRKFDPSAPDAYATAYDLLVASDAPSATPTAFRDAEDYLDRCAVEDARQAWDDAEHLWDLAERHYGFEEIEMLDEIGKLNLSQLRWDNIFAPITGEGVKEEKEFWRRQVAKFVRHRFLDADRVIRVMGLSEN